MKIWISLLLACGLCVIAGIVANKWMRIRCWHMARQRTGATREHFIRFFEQRAISSQISGAVYDFFQDWMRNFGVNRFPVFPEDDAIDVYRFDPSDLYTILAKLAARCERQMISVEELKTYRRPETIGEIVSFLAARPPR